LSTQVPTSHHWSQAVRAHHTSPTSVALATSPPTSGIQAIHPRLPFVGRYNAPSYQADECTLVTAAGGRPLWSADSRTCMVKKSHNQFYNRCFATAGPTLWNSLPEQLWQPDITFRQFKRSLKTFMFG